MGRERTPQGNKVVSKEIGGCKSRRRVQFATPKLKFVGDWGPKWGSFGWRLGWGNGVRRCERENGI